MTIILTETQRTVTMRVPHDTFETGKWLQPAKKKEEIET